MFGIENGLCEKSIFLSSSFHSYIGKSTIQQNSKRSLAMRLELFADLGARRAGELDEILRLAGDEEHGVAVLEAELLARSLRCAPAPRLLATGPAPDPPRLLAPEDVAEARLALALRPGVHAVAEGARAAARRRNRPDRRLGLVSRMRAKILKPEPRKTSRDVLHHDRIAQVRLVGAVFAIASA